ncbi:alpha/beta hydrolase [Streptomyces sp. PTM05]|uniref:Alpha/beta hydrolase n=1 Tax=Streptantibioticus parmotrematis TaxID=2873249 RepID=A0ABS7QLX3_9ACTN|nr:alpha/beta fold hydrolase [Streptantibioticus parmotrematis]MBY8884195.1 alpha/beta hydrolase [Streptantibioticus parmotrematis]
MSRPPILDVPESARAYRLPTARGEFAVLDAGEARRGTALLVPGFTGSKEDFVALLDPLARAGWRVVAVDGRGQFESGGPREESAYAREELVADLLAQAAALDAGPVHLLGHSFGGLVARSAVLADAGPWASLTLMSSGPAAIEEDQRKRTGMLLRALVTMDMETVWRAMRALDAEDPTAAAGGAEPDGMPEGLDAFLHRRWVANVPEQLIVTGRQLVAEPDRVAELAAVALPKLVVSGAVDYAWPVPWLDAMAERLGARREVIEGAEHSPNAERPEATAAVLDAFWGDVPPSATRQ